MKQIKITIDGKEYDAEMSDEQIQEIVGKKQFPKWDDLQTIEGYYVDDFANIVKQEKQDTESGFKNTRATEEQAQACIAMAQLSQLMKHCNGGWEQELGVHVYVIYYSQGEITKSDSLAEAFLMFPTKEMCDGFLEAYRDLIEQAKPLL